jgi:hypothetical protein
MTLRLTTVHEKARSALECGGSTPPWIAQGIQAKGGRRRQAAALQGAFGTGRQWAAGTKTVPSPTATQFEPRGSRNYPMPSAFCFLPSAFLRTS